MVSHALISHKTSPFPALFSRKLTRPIHQRPIILVPRDNINNPSDPSVLFSPPPIRISLLQIPDRLVPLTPLQLLQSIEVSSHARARHISHDRRNTLWCSWKVWEFPSPGGEEDELDEHDCEDGEAGDAPE